MIYLSIHVPAACSYLPPLRGALKVACGHSTTALKLPLSRHPATIARCKVSSAPGERLLRRLAGGALEVFQAAPVPPRHLGETHPGQLPAERTLGSQVPSQSRCCTHRRLLRTLHLSTGAEQGGRDARSVHRPQHGSRAHALPSRARPRAHSHMRSPAHTLVPPPGLAHALSDPTPRLRAAPASAPAPPSTRVTHARTAVACASTCALAGAGTQPSRRAPPRLAHTLSPTRPASAPRPPLPLHRRLSSPRMPGRAAARRRSASTRRQRSHHAELDSACGAVSPFEMVFESSCVETERCGFSPALLH